MRVLIVEDSFLIATEAEVTLRRAQHDVVGCAPTAEDAYRLAKATQPDLALIDVHLRDGRKGVEVSHRLHDDYGVRSLLVTANCAIGRGAKDGALGCLSKPYKPQDLVRSVEICRRLLAGCAPEPHDIPELELF